MKLRIARFDDDLWQVLPDEWAEKFGVKEGEEFPVGPLIAELEKNVAARQQSDDAQRVSE